LRRYEISINKRTSRTLFKSLGDGSGTEIERSLYNIQMGAVQEGFQTEEEENLRVITPIMARRGRRRTIPSAPIKGGPGYRGRHPVETRLGNFKKNWRKSQQQRRRLKGYQKGEKGPGEGTASYLRKGGKHV